ncbi:MAG: nucleoside-diphosphate sugar epimerase/dehydratase [Phycisphaerales bacterium]|nr:nucleoside-diphosphate sugar epimerase/dehydratase [Phycisphaerales bacterium]
MQQQWFIRLPRPAKQLLAMMLDSGILAVAVWTACALRTGEFWPDALAVRWWLILAVPALGIPVFRFVHLYRTVVRHLGNRFAFSLFLGVSLSTALMCLMLFMSGASPALSYSTLGIYWALAVVGVGGSRIMVRTWFRSASHGSRRPIIIYGAGDAGAQLQNAIANSGRYRLVGFVDDNPSCWKTVVNGATVHEPSSIGRLVRKHGCEEIFLAIPSSSLVERREIIGRLRDFPLMVRTVPSLTELVEGRVTLEEMRPIAIEDLLGRDQVQPKRELLDRCIRGKVVMVTGAGGSIGSELCRQILRLDPKRLVLFERSEFALYQIHQEMLQAIEAEGLDVGLSPLLGSVDDRELVRGVMDTFSIETIYHAAAYKHVPLVEYNTAAGVRNNALATWVLAEAAMAAGVSSFILISTDKAVRPTNVMGASKRLAELVLQALQLRGSSTRFCMVRFGNVLDSSGSVVPVFKRQITEGGPISVTHPDVIRYFMTIPEAAALVLQAGSMGSGGDVFLLDMGDAVKIADLARLMIRLAGLTERTKDRPNGDIEIVFTGLRPGEKLYEELLIGDDILETEHPMIMRGNEESIPWDELEPWLTELESACTSSNVPVVIDLLQRAVSGFTPLGDSSDVLWRIRGGSSVADHSILSD